ncbi:glycerate kinase type-2 family protein [Yoonia sp. 208BN28-4]|uniref:glycerate kinase type-2 family protein n=1 Tax=Yoonia sp. 208BN28-4 TaxID=3126505 RepID=UPI0030AAD99F
MTTARNLARSLFDEGVAAADPAGAVARHLHDVDPPALIVAVGKAALKMAEAALARFPQTPCLVVTNYENAKPLAGATVMAAGHPVPDEAGADAGRAVLGAVGQVKGPVLALISGGGSALLPAPAGRITLADKAALNGLLLGCGLDITQMNLIRQQVSLIKGGGLVRAATPQAITALILSDVVGDDLSTIASGPTARPLGTASQARAIMLDAGIWDNAPASVRDYLEADRAELPEVAPARNVLVGSNGQSVAAMAAQAGEAQFLPRPVEGDVHAAAREICDAAGLGITLWGGETTVQLRGTGRGGRNQELALLIAIEAAQRGWKQWTCLQGGTDGRDGPTDAAGGLVDDGTLARVAAAGGDLDALLANNDSYQALNLAGDLLMTDATGTNVADLGIMIRED